MQFTKYIPEEISITKFKFINFPITKSFYNTLYNRIFRRLEDTTLQ